MRVLTICTALFPLLLAACGDKDDDTGAPAEADADTDSDTDADTDSDTDSDTDADTDSDTDADPASYTGYFNEFMSGDPIVGGTVTYGSETYTTDEEGSVAIEVAESTEATLSLVAEGYPDAYVYRYQGTSAVLSYTDVPSDGTLSLLSGGLGIPLDETKGILAVTISEFDPDNATESQAIGNVTVDLDVGYDAALISDSEAGFGISGGNTTKEGSPSVVIFVNVEAGTATPSFTLPDGVVCEYGHASVEVVADSFMTATYYCSVD